MVPVLVPPENPNATVSPPVVSELPAASFASRRSVTAEPEATVPLDAVITDVAGEIAPGDTAIVGNGVAVTGAPLIVAPIVVAVPATTPVNTAVYTPFPLSAVALIVPVLVPPERVNTTTAPPVVMSFPAASLP